MACDEIKALIWVPLALALSGYIVSKFTSKILDFIFIKPNNDIVSFAPIIYFIATFFPENAYTEGRRFVILDLLLAGVFKLVNDDFLKILRISTLIMWCVGVFSVYLRYGNVCVIFLPEITNIDFAFLAYFYYAGVYKNKSSFFECYIGALCVAYLYL